MAGQAPPFYMGFRLAEIEFDCGTITPAIYNRAPGGSFGKVLRGSWRGFRVAVKILAKRPGVLPNDADAEFRREVQNMIAVRSTIDRARVQVRLGAVLSEPCELPDVARRCTQLHSLGGWANAAVVFGVGSEPDLTAAAPGLPPGPAHLIVMEELTGGTLEAPPADLKERVRVAAGLAGGLSLLAAAHVVHADLKGANLMLRTPGGDVVLTDYGVGRIARSGVGGDGSTGDASGTMLYLAPELFAGGLKNSFASDVYAYGLVLWCLFSGRRHAFADATGRVPTTLPDLIALLNRVALGERPDLAALRPDTPSSVTALIERCWAQDPAVRPTAVAVAQETAAWLAPPDPRDAVIRDLRARVTAADGRVTTAEAALAIELAAKADAQRRVAAAEAAQAASDRRAEVAQWLLEVAEAANAASDRRATEAEAAFAIEHAAKIQAERRAAAADAAQAAAVRRAEAAHRRAEAAEAAKAETERRAAGGAAGGGTVDRPPADHPFPAAAAAGTRAAVAAAQPPPRLFPPPPTPGPADLSSEHAAQLQAWLPPGGSPSPGAWQEVYRATTHGFGAAAFHARCDGCARLLLLVRARDGGWLFGGFTAVGFIPPLEHDWGYIADPSAFLFSLTNLLGRPEKLASKGTGRDLIYNPGWSATFGTGNDLRICDNANLVNDSYTKTGGAYAAAASSDYLITGAPPMRLWRQHFKAAEVVAWHV